MIVATAGHVDHGKTLLVKALTGTDADRLPEEKRRGMTIDLGFAYAGPLGFIDVPGHEDFIHNMLAGVTGIDFALLVVAADEGVMPQTREHAAILDLLDIRRGAIALTKIDRADDARRAEVAEQARALFPAEVFPVSAVTGEGIAALRAHLEGVRAAADAVHGNFRLSIDRAFTLQGAGVVVTGTVFSGEVRVGGTLTLSPRGTPVRIRAIHAQNRSAEMARAGERAALNLAGDIHLSGIARGDWIVDARAHAPVRKIDARIRALAPVAHWTPVHIHLGAADVTGRVAVLGETLVQLHLDRPIGALAGDRFILRDQSARRTLAGGRVVDIFPPARGRARPERLAYLRALEERDAPPAALAAAPDGVDLAQFVQARNLTADEAAALRARVQPVVVEGRAFLPARWAALEAAVLDALTAWHAANPGAAGPSEDALRRTLDPKPAAATMALAVRALVAAGKVARAQSALRLAAHQVRLPPADAALWAKAERALDQSAARPPAVAELAQAAGVAPDKLKAVLKRAARLGLVIQIAENRFAKPADVARLARIAEQLAGDSGAFTAAAFRDRSGLGRNLAIDVLEFFDKAGFTRRHGDHRRIAAAGRFGAAP